jgi:hypothetical protein
MKAIVTKYHGPTNTRGARVSASDSDGNKVTLSYDHSLNSGEMHVAAARALAAKMDWHGVLIEGSLASGYVFVWANGDTHNV